MIPPVALLYAPVRCPYTPVVLFCAQVETQRVQHKKLSRLYDPSTGAETGVLPNKRLTAERLQKLEAIGFAWSAKVARRNSASAAVGKHDDMDGGMPSLGTAGAPVAAPNAIAAGDGDVVTNPTQQAPQQQARRSRLNDSQWEGKIIVRQRSSVLDFLG
jgi:hypothetical protein